MPGFATRDGLALPAASAHRPAQCVAAAAFRLSAPPPFNIASVVGMGWVQGLNLAPLAFIMTAAVFRADRSGARGSGADVRARRLASVMRRIDLAARLARHPRRRHLYLHHRLRRFRRAGDHRLVEPALHLLDLSRAAAHRRQTAAALRRRRGALDLADRARRRSELVVRAHAASARIAIRSCAARPIARSSSRSAARKYPAWGCSPASISALGKLLPLLRARLGVGCCPISSCPRRRRSRPSRSRATTDLPWSIYPRQRSPTPPILMRADADADAGARASRFSWIVLRSRLPRPRLVRFHRLPAACRAEHRLRRRRAALRPCACAAGRAGSRHALAAARRSSSSRASPMRRA